MFNINQIKVLNLNLCMLVILIQFTFSVIAQENQIAQYLDKQRSDYIEGMLQENPVLITQYHAESIRLMPEANPSILGKNDAHLFFLEWFERFEISAYKRVETEVINMDERIAELGIFELKMINSEGAFRTITGKYLNFWVEHEHGFELVTDMWNFDHWLDFKEELIFANVPATITALEAHLPINTPILFDLAAYQTLSDANVPMRDANVLAQFYTDDAKIMTNFRPAIVGKQAIQNYWQAHAKELVSFEKLQGRTDKIDIIGPYVITYGSHIANWRNGLDSGVSTGKHFRIWRREPHGGLRTMLLFSAYDK